MNRFHGDDVDHVENQRRQIPQNGAQKNRRFRQVRQHHAQLRSLIVFQDIVDNRLDIIKDHRGRPADCVHLVEFNRNVERMILCHVEELADQTYAAERRNVSPK